MNDQDLVARRRAALGPTYQNFDDEPLRLVRGGNPVSAAVGKAVIDVIESGDPLQNARDTGTSGRYRQILKLRPPLVFSRADADRTIAAIDTALRQFEP